MSSEQKLPGQEPLVVTGYGWFHKPSFKVSSVTAAVVVFKLLAMPDHSYQQEHIITFIVCLIIYSYEVQE